MSVAMGFPGATIGWAFSEWYKGGNSEISADSTIASLIIWFSASCVILILFIASRACSARRRSKLHGMLLILEQELENEQIAKRAHCIIR